MSHYFGLVQDAYAFFERRLLPWIADRDGWECAAGTPVIEFGLFIDPREFENREQRETTAGIITLTYPIFDPDDPPKTYPQRTGRVVYVNQIIHCITVQPPPARFLFNTGQDYVFEMYPPTDDSNFKNWKMVSHFIY